MPALHALGQHPALQAAHSHLREETSVAFLDDVYTVVHQPDRVGHLHDTLNLKHTATCASTRGKRECGTRLTTCPRILASPGCRTCPVELTLVPGVFGSDTFVRTELQVSQAGHDQLLQRLPKLDDLQASWLLLFFVLPAATIFSGCSPRRSRPSTLAPTIRPSCQPSRTFWAWMAFPTMLNGSPS